MQILFISFAVGFAVFLIASVFIWVCRVQRFVESHGEHSASLVFAGAMLRDYQTARRIADRIGRKPGFLILFERLFVTATVFFIAAVLVALIGSLR